MRVLMYGAPMMRMQKTDIVGMLGSMFTANKRAATVLGLMPHFMAGVEFALLYALLWSMGIGSAMWLWGLVFWGRARDCGHGDGTAADAHAPSGSRDGWKRKGNGWDADGPLGLWIDRSVILCCFLTSSFHLATRAGRGTNVRPVPYRRRL